MITIFNFNSNKVSCPIIFRYVHVFHHLLTEIHDAQNEFQENPTQINSFWFELLMIHDPNTAVFLPAVLTKFYSSSGVTSLLTVLFLT